MKYPKCIIAMLMAASMQVSAQSNSKIGANLPEITDYSGTPVFVDIMKSSRAPLKGTQFSTLATVDANGWPTEDCQIIFISANKEWSPYLAGTYKLSFKGKADVTKCCSNVVTVKNVVYNSSINVTTADIDVVNNSVDPVNMTLQFKNIGAGITDIKLIRPNQNPTEVFTKEFKDHLKRFAVLRCMDWGHTNGSPQKDFTKRLTDLSASQFVNGKSVAYEYMAQLANETGKDLWITIPLHADDNFVTQTAKLFKQKLNPAIKLYVEYSNELWNFGFTQYGQNMKLAKQEVATGTSTLDDPDGKTTLSSKDSLTFMFRRVAKRGMEIGNVFRQEFGESTPFGRIRPILAGQYSNPEPIIERGLRFIDQYYGKPNKYFYAIASAPYFNCDAVDQNPNATKQDYLNELKKNAEAQYSETFTSQSTKQKRFDHWIARATFYGLKNVMYEGGPDTFGPANITAKRQSQEDKQMKDILYNYYLNYYRTTDPDGFAMQFFCGSSDFTTQYGTWGLNHNWHMVEAAPKTKAIDSLNAQPRPEIMEGWPIANTLDSVDSRKHTYATFGNTSNFDLSNSCACNTNLHNGYFNGYLINVKNGGKYSLRLRTQRPMPSGKKTVSDVYLNNELVDSIVVKNAGPSDPQPIFIVSDSIPITLKPGLNVIELRYRGESTANKAILFRLLQKISVSVPELNAAKKVKIYPQPASDLLTVELKDKQHIKSLVLYDLQGREVVAKISNEVSSHSAQVKLQGLNTGVYVLQIETEEGQVLREKFIKE